MANDKRKTERLPYGWEVHTFQIGVPIGDCAIHLLVKNAIRYTDGKDFKIPNPGEKTAPRLEQPMFRKIVQLEDKDQPAKGGDGLGEIHAALLFDGGHDDNGPGYNGNETSNRIKETIKAIEVQYKIDHGNTESIECTPFRDKKTTHKQQLIFDAWVVTHWDRDHYCGALTMFHDDVHGQWEKAKKAKKDASDPVCSYFKYGKGKNCNSILYCPAWERSKVKDAARGSPNLFVSKEKGNIWLVPTPKRSPLDLKVEEATMTWSKSAALFSIVCGEDALIGTDFFSGNRVCGEPKPTKAWWNKKEHRIQSVFDDYAKRQNFDGAKPIFLCVGVNGYVFSSTSAAPKPKAHCTPDNYVSIMALIAWKTASGIRISHLCGGDAHAVTEKTLLTFLEKPNSTNNSPQYWPIEVLKASHHGARSSTPIGLVRACKPSKFVISAGESHGHPSWQTVALMVTYFRSERRNGGGSARVKERPLYNLQFPYYLPWDDSMGQVQKLATVDVNLESYRVNKSDWRLAFQEAYGNDSEVELYGDEKKFKKEVKKLDVEDAGQLAGFLYSWCSVLKGIDCLFDKFDADKSLTEAVKKLTEARKELNDMPKNPTQKAKILKRQNQVVTVSRLFANADKTLQSHRRALAYLIRYCWCELSEVLDYQKNSPKATRGLLYLVVHASAEDRFDGRAMPVSKESKWSAVQDIVRFIPINELEKLLRTVLRSRTRKKKVEKPKAGTRLMSVQTLDGGGSDKMEEEPPNLFAKPYGMLYGKRNFRAYMEQQDPALYRNAPVRTLKRVKVQGLITDAYTLEPTPLESQPMDLVVLKNGSVLGSWESYKADPDGDTEDGKLAGLGSLEGNELETTASEAEMSDNTDEFTQEGEYKVIKRKSTAIAASKARMADVATARAVPISGLISSAELIEDLLEDHPTKTFSVVEEGASGWELLAWTGPIQFDKPITISSGLNSDCDLANEDTTLGIMRACWPMFKDDKVAGTFISKMDARVEAVAANSAALRLVNLRLHLAKDSAHEPLVFSSKLEVLNNQFESNESSSRSKLSGFQRFPGLLLLGLEPGTATGGFDTLADLFDLVGIDPGFWLQSLSTSAKVEVSRSPKRLTRNGIWYMPSKNCTSVLRLSGVVRLDAFDSLGPLGDIIQEYLRDPSMSSGSRIPNLPELSVVVMKKAAPVIEPEISFVDTDTKLTLGTKLSIGSTNGVGIYFSLHPNQITITLMSNSKNVTWSALKSWIQTKFNELTDSLESLSSNITTLVKNQGREDMKVSGNGLGDQDIDGIFFRKMTVTVDKDRKLLNASLTFEASMPYLVEKGKHAVFELKFSWSPGLYEFHGEFIGNGLGELVDGIPNNYLASYEPWNTFQPLSENCAAYMSLRYINPDSPISTNEIPYGVPTEIEVCDLRVSNRMARLEGVLASRLQPPASTSNVPSLHIAHVQLRINAELDYSSSPIRPSFELDGLIALTPSGDTLDGLCLLRASVGYKSNEQGEGSWSFSASATNIALTSLYSLFAPGSERLGVMAMLSYLHLNELSLKYTYSKASVSEFDLHGEMDIAGLTALVTYKRSSSSSWKFMASVSQSSDPESSEPSTLASAIKGLLGDEVVSLLPEFVLETKMPTFDPESSKIQLKCTESAFGVELSFGKLHIQVGQVKQVQKGGAAEESISIKRLIRVSLGPLPSMGDLPLIGVVNLPFDSLEFLWLSDDFSSTDIAVLNAVVFSDSQLLASPDGKLARGYHFQLVSENEVWIDHQFAHKPDSPPIPHSGALQVDAAAEKGQIITAAAEPAAPSAMKPIKKKQGGLNISGIGISYSNKMLCIHLDAEVSIGPISAGVLGLSVKIDLGKVRGLHQLLALNTAAISELKDATTVSLDGLDLAFERAPIMIAGGLYHTQNQEEGEIYCGGIAIALTELSICAFGLYQAVPEKPPIPSYDSVFIYAMLEGTLFTVGWAEVRGIIAGFGYNSKLRLPVGDELIGYPLLEGFSPDFNKSMRLLHKSAYVTPSLGSLWIAAGLVIRAFQTMDIRAVATFSIGPDQKELAILARATATLPRGSKPEKALMLIDLSLVGKLDFLHGEFAVDGAINPTSFILTKDCVPSGGFAIRSWFGSDSPYAGDWVVSFGGYHPAYARPAHYPNPSRLRISWIVSEKISVTGEAYAAVTPGALMAGGLLHAVYQWGGLRANFDAHADFLVTLAPLHYMAEMEVFASVKYEYRKWFITIKMSAELRARLCLYGPPLAGTATFNLDFYSFSTEFGAGSDSGSPKALQLHEFVAVVRETAADGKKNKAHVLAVTGGLLAVKSDAVEARDVQAYANNGEDETPWTVRSNEFAFTIRSCAPISVATVNQDAKNEADGHANKILSRPMWMRSSEATGLSSELTLRVYKGDKSVGEPLNMRVQEAILDKVPSNLWGEYSDNQSDLLNPSKMAPMADHLVGFKVLPPVPEVPTDHIILSLSKLVSSTTQTVTSAIAAVPVQSYLHAESMPEQAKWNRVKAVLNEKSVSIQRDAIMDAFLTFHKRDVDTAKGFRDIGTRAPQEMLNDPERFYRNAPNVLYR